MKKILSVLLVIPIIFWMVWIAFPKTSIESIIDDSINDEKLSMEIKGIEKGLFYNLSIDSLKLKNSGLEMLSLNNIHARINPFALVIFHSDFSFNGNIGGGDISGSIKRTREKVRMNFDIERVSIDKIALFRIAGIKGKGTVSGRFNIIDGTGHVEFVTNDASFEPMTFSGVAVPLNFFHSVKGAMDVKGNIIDIVSIALEGKDIYARLKGFIRNSVMDINMEIMPGKSFIENPIFFSSLEKYKVSPGYYVISIRGNLPV